MKVYEDNKYIVSQSNINNHIMIFDKQINQMVYHINYSKKATKEDAKKILDYLLEI